MPESAPQLGVPQEGELIAGRYRVERELATGGMGVVLLALDRTCDQRVAIKVMLPAAMEVEGAVTRFQREAQAAAGIKSEHVVQISDVGTLRNGAPFMVMEYLEGEDLGEVVGAHKALPAEEAVDYVLQVCEAMAEAHRGGIVHRDLKPSNLFRANRPGGAPCIKVLDFGISKFAAGSDVLGKEAASLTATRAMMGSPLYMSPEQVRSAKNVDRRTDIWSLGVILYELLSGRLPFEADTAGAICAMIVADEPVPLRWMRKDLSEDLEKVVMRCLAKEPAARFQDVAELAVALRPFASMVGDVAAANASRTMEHASGILPTLHAAPIKLDLAQRAASAPLAKTSVATPSGRKRSAEAKSDPPAPIERPRRSSGAWRVFALAVLFGGVGVGAWHFRARLVAAAASGLRVAGSETGAPAGSAENPATPLDDAARSGENGLLLVDPLDAAVLLLGAPADSGATELEAEDAGDAREDAGDAGEDDEDEEEDAAAVMVAPHPSARPNRPAKPHVPVKKKKKKKATTRR